MTLARVVALWRYPVKSMAGEPLDDAEVTTGGIPGDRCFGVIERRTGRILTAKTEPRLLAASARVAGDERVTLDVPGAGELSSDDPGVHELLSGWLDRDVALSAPVPGHRTTVAMETDDGVVTFETPAGSFFDSRSSLHLLTEASLQAAARLHPRGDWDARRFRPNLLLAGDAEGFAEDGWTGEHLRLGTATAWVRKPTKRCVLPTRQQHGLPRDRQLLQTLAREHDTMLGVYANPVEAGRVAVGDPITMIHVDAQG